MKSNFLSKISVNFRMPILAASIFNIAVLSATASEIDKNLSKEKETAAYEGKIITLWPLFDYRSSPSTGYKNLSILGPLFKREQNNSTTKTAFRPLFFSTATADSVETDILYPMASSNSDTNSGDRQILKLYQNHVTRRGTTEEKDETMLFPFYISGISEKYGAYRSFFPFHGDIYERFWRDEYHYTLFPLYGQTVKNGTTSTNYLYPFFSTVSGENESGFQLWPIYGQAEKKGVYEKGFILWPFFTHEIVGKNTDNQTETWNLLPFYASSKSPQSSSTHLPWPFTGVVRDNKGEVIERDIFWPLWMTRTGKESHTERYLPFYSQSNIKENKSRWILWPIYHDESINSAPYRQDKTSLLYFLFNSSEESWKNDAKQSSKSTFWPLYAFKRDEQGIRTLSLPALVEPVVWSEGVERNWAPLWRLYISTWDEAGNSATSILWNLFWHERRGDEVAWEFSPLFSWYSSNKLSGFKLLKGIFGIEKRSNSTALSLLWMTFGVVK